jgi:hypothetical protein
MLRDIEYLVNLPPKITQVSVFTVVLPPRLGIYAQATAADSTRLFIILLSQLGDAERFDFRVMPAGNFVFRARSRFHGDVCRYKRCVS